MPFLLFLNSFRITSIKTKSIIRSFIDFVGEHFGIGHHESPKHPHHKQDECPTNHDHALVSLTFVVEKKDTLEAISEDIAFFAERTPVPPYQTFFSEFHSSIWQPPKLS